MRRLLQKDFVSQSQPLLLWKKKTDIKAKWWTGCLRAGRGCVIVTTNHFTHVSTSKSWDLEKDIAFHFDREINKIHRTNKYDNWQLLFDLMWQSLNSTYCATCMRLRGNYLSGNPAHQSRQKQNISRPSVYTMYIIHTYVYVSDASKPEARNQFPRLVVNRMRRHFKSPQIIPKLSPIFRLVQNKTWGSWRHSWDTRSRGCLLRTWPERVFALIPHICHEHHERRSCKFFLAGVNFYRFNAKNWHFWQILSRKVVFFYRFNAKNWRFST